MSATAKWVFGVAMGLISVIGLFLASRATDDVMYFVGLLFFVFGVLFNFGMIGRHVGHHHAHDDRAAGSTGHSA